MAEVLKRWNGSSWFPVSAVNRIEVISGDDTSQLLMQPRYGKPKKPNTPTKKLNINDYLDINYSWEIKD